MNWREVAKAREKPENITESFTLSNSHTQTCTYESNLATLSPKAADQNPHGSVLGANSSDFTLTMNTPWLQLNSLLPDEVRYELCPSPHASSVRKETGQYLYFDSFYLTPFPLPLTTTASTLLSKLLNFD